jgi:hypothetical protein
MATIRNLLVLAILAPSSLVGATNCPIPGFSYAAFGDTGVTMQNGNTDSWDSSLGGYATSKCALMSPCVGGVATNNSASGAISLGPNGDVNGQCSIGPSGTTANITPNANKCDSLGIQGSTLDLPVPTLPATTTNLGAISNSINIPSAGAYRATSISLSGNKALTVTAGPVVIYLTGSGNVLSLSGNGAMNNNTQIPSNLIFMCTSSAAQTISVVGNGNAYYGIYCPKADITIAGNGTIYGAIVGKSVTFNGNNGYVHYDKALQNLTSSQITCATGEVSRATPIAATVSNQQVIVQGTFEPAITSPKTILSTTDVANFEFPHIQGHMRARVASTITTTASTFASGTIVFDAATAIPPIPHIASCTPSFNASCRTVFTNTNTTPSSGTTTFSGPPASRITVFNDTNASTIGALIAPAGTGANQVNGIGATHWQTIVRRVLAGQSNGTTAKLGGVDRSTVAVIGPSSVAGLSTRPTMTYFGGTDGMLHAVCTSTGGTTASGSNICPSTLGTELWAFMPRVQLPLVRVNKQRIDGSVRVVDAFGTFPDPTTGAVTGAKSWRTILTFQTGYSDGTFGSKPAVYALDVTDPAKPILLWEYTTPSSTGAQLGVGLAMHAGPTLVSNVITNLAVAQTNNGGSGGSGMVVNALQLETGAPKWSNPFSYIYTSPRPSSQTHDGGVPATGIPGGAVGVDLASKGFTSDLVMGDLYGNLWRIDAATGANTLSSPTSPLFSFTTDKHPIGALPAILDNNGAKVAVFGTGGYADPSGAASWTTTGQRLIGVRLTGTSTLNESSTGLAFSQSLGSNDKVAAQVLIVGREVFVTTDTSDINSSTYGTNSTATGNAYEFDLAAQNPAIAFIHTLQGGASSLAFNNSNGTLVGGASDKTQQLTSTGSTTGGTSVDYQKSPTPTRLTWISSRR